MILLVQIGLSLNIIGTVILCFYGFPNDYFSKDGGAILTYAPPNQKEKNKKHNKRKICWAITGVVLLILGFIFQFVSTLC